MLEPLAVMLLIPGLALLMYRANVQRRHGLDRETREFSRRVIGVLGWVVLAHAGLFAYWAASDLIRFPFAPRLALHTLLRCALIGLLLYAGRAAVAIGRHEEQPDLPWPELSLRERQSEALTFSMVLLAIVPLLIPGSIAFLLIAGLIGIEFAVFALAQRARENRLLWTLSLAARHGLSFADEVESLAFSERRRHQNRLLNLANDLRNGTALSQALLNGPRLVPPEAAATIQAAEQEGTLAQALPELARRHTQRLRRFHWDSTLNNVTVYAWAVTLMTIWIAGFVLYWIVPKFKEIFLDFGMELPRVTESFISVSDFAVLYSFLLIPALSLPFLALFAFTYVSIAGGRWMPGFIKSLFPRLATPTLLRALGSSAARRESLTAALAGLEHSTVERSWTSRYHTIRLRIEAGEPVADAVFSEGFINLREAHAIGHAERVGHLSWALNALADRLEQLRMDRFRWSVEMIKPLVVVLLGCAVAYYSIAMFLPLVKLLNELS